MSNVIFKQCNNTNYRTGRTGAIKYIVIHYTSNNGDTAKNNVDYFASATNLQASAHYFVDEYDNVYQSVKDADTAWHCGTSGTYYHTECRNANSIGIEMCSRKDASGAYYFKAETINNAIRLTKELMQKYGIDSNHVVRHYDVTHKICPAPFVNNSVAWNDFKSKLSNVQFTETAINLNGKINTEVLNIRALPSTTSNIIGKHVAGDIVKLASKTDNGWYRVDYPNIGKGYIYAQYVDIINTESPTIIKPKNDNTPDSWAEDAVKQALTKGIICGDDNGNLKLHTNCTRQEAVVFLYKFYKLIK